jgi:hypothetical protein
MIRAHLLAAAVLGLYGLGVADFVYSDFNETAGLRFNGAACTGRHVSVNYVLSLFDSFVVLRFAKQSRHYQSRASQNSTEQCKAELSSPVLLFLFAFKVAFTALTDPK